MTAFSYSSYVKHHFSQYAREYTEVSIIPREIQRRLLERLQWIKLSPKLILDLGCGNGHSIFPLQTMFPKANVLGIDLSLNMLCQSPCKGGLVCSDAFKLPLRNHSIDLVFSNLLFPWCDDLKTLFSECRRILSRTGLFIFASYGPASLNELRQRSNHFIDMHNLGDLLMDMGFSDPVMDMETILVNYNKKQSQLDSDIRFQGFELLFNDSMKVFADVTTLTYEIVYGLAWYENSVRVPVSKLIRS